MKQKIEEMLKEELKQSVKELALEYLSVTELQELVKEKADTPIIRTDDFPVPTFKRTRIKFTHPYSPEVPKITCKDDNGKINS